MPTTSYTDTTFSVSAIGNRTDSAGAAVVDYTAEEARFAAQIFTAGYLKPAGAFQVAPQAVPDMTVKVGSGTAKADYYVIEGQAGGQGNYVVRLDVTFLNVTVPAADAAQDRTDEVYLVVRDNAYDASSRALPQIGYRQGDVGGVAPGPDSTWEAYSLLATIAVPALETAIEAANLTDERVAAELQLSETLAPALRVVRSSKDAEGVWTTISWYRSDTTLAQTSVLSGGTTPEYTTRTVTEYEDDGTTVSRTTTYTLSYDVDGDFESEVFA